MNEFSCCIDLKQSLSISSIDLFASDQLLHPCRISSTTIAGTRALSSKRTGLRCHHRNWNVFVEDKFIYFLIRFDSNLMMSNFVINFRFALKNNCSQWIQKVANLRWSFILNWWEVKRERSTRHEKLSTRGDPLWTSR